MFKKIFNTDEKRFWFLVGLIAIVGVAVAIFIMTRPVKENIDIKSDTLLTSTEREEISKTVQTVIETSTKWGLKPDALAPDSALSVRDIISVNGVTAGEYWVSRNEVYLGLKDLHLVPFGPLWYESGKVASWFDSYSRDYLASFTPGDVTVTVPENSSTLTASGEVLPAATVSVDFSVTETRRVQTVNDSSWDGTFNIEEKTFNDSAKVIVVLQEGEWKVYDIRGLQFPFLQATWGTPDQSYENFQFDFIKIGEFKANLEEN